MTKKEKGPKIIADEKQNWFQSIRFYFAEKEWRAQNAALAAVLAVQDAVHSPRTISPQSPSAPPNKGETPEEVLVFKVENGGAKEVGKKVTGKNFSYLNKNYVHDKHYDKNDKLDADDGEEYVFAERWVPRKK